MLSLIVFNQVAIMVALIAVGYLAFKLNILSKEGSKEISRLLTMIITPVVIVKSFMVESSPEKTQMLLYSLMLGLISLLITFIFAYFTEKKNPALQYGVSFSNAGFIGIPLILNTLGSEALFYMLAFFSMQIMSVWTLGIFMLTRDRHLISIKQLLKTPTIWAIFVGLAVYFLQISFPDNAMSIVNNMSSTYSPLAMFVVGTLLAEIKFKDMFGDNEVYIMIALRLIIIPLVIALVFVFIPGASELHLLTKTAIVIVSSAPAGANTAILSHMFDLKTDQAVKAVTLSTLLSVLTIPMIVFSFEYLLNIFTSGL